MFSVELTSLYFFSVHHRGRPPDMRPKYASDLGSGHGGTEGFLKNKLVKMPRAPEPRTISLLQAAVEWECGSGAELNGGLWDCRGVVC